MVACPKVVDVSFLYTSRNSSSHLFDASVTRIETRGTSVRKIHR